MRFSGELESLFGRMSHTITLCGAFARDWRLFGIFIAIRFPPAWLLNLTIGLGPRLDGSAWRRPTLLSPAQVRDHRRFVLITIGVPSNPNFSLSRLIRYRSAEKCRSPALSVNTMNVGGRTLPWVM